MSTSPLFSNQSGGFGPETLLELETGLRAKASHLVPGTRLAGGRVVTSCMRAMTASALQIGEGIYSSGCLLETGTGLISIEESFGSQITDRVQDVPLIYLCTDSFNILTPLGVLCDFWITQARKSQIAGASMKGLPVDG